MNTFRKILLLFVVSIISSLFTNAQEEEKPTFKPSMKMEGRIMYDFNFLSDGDDYFYKGNEFRRVRLAAKGKVAENVGYKAEFDFAKGKLGFRDVYLKFILPSDAGNLMVGSFTEPSSLDNMTSSKYITFFERSMMANTQPYKYNAGFMYDNQKLVDGKIGIQMSYTFNGSKNSGAAFTDGTLGGGANFVARLTGIPYQNKENNQVVHLGVNIENRVDENEEYGYEYRFENHMGDKMDLIEFGNVKNVSDMGFELATTFGPVSIQGEFENATINTNEDDDNKYTSAGYYAFASFFVTGEHRPYKNSTFGRVKPNKNFCLKDGGFGAFELVARYSVMDYSDYPGVDNDETYKIANLTAGFNWYLNKNTRIMYNYTSGSFYDFEFYGEDDKLSGHLIRFQIDF